MEKSTFTFELLYVIEQQFLFDFSFNPNILVGVNLFKDKKFKCCLKLQFVLK